MTPVDRDRLARVLADEQRLYEQLHPRSHELFSRADHLFGRVPMTWMNKWSGGFPLYLDRAHGNRITDVDGRDYIDFALGDTGAMAGHSPSPVVEAVQQRIGTSGGITTMLPTEDAEWVGSRLVEILPIGLGDKQACLEMDDPLERLAVLSPLIRRAEDGVQDA